MALSPSITHSFLQYQKLLREAFIRHAKEENYPIVHTRDTVSEVLSYVEYEPKRLLEKFKARAELAVKEHGATLEELKELVSTYRESLRGYTYYESD